MSRTRSLNLPAFLQRLAQIHPDVGPDLPVSDVQSVLARDCKQHEAELNIMREAWRAVEYDRELPPSPWTS